MDQKKWQYELEQLVEILHQCTGLLIAGYTAHGDMICTRGNSDEDLQVLLTAREELHQTWQCVSQGPTVCIPGFGQLIIISICHHCINKGYLALGPFSDSSETSIEKRTPTIIPYILHLVRLIQNRTLTECNGYDNIADGLCCLHVQKALHYINNHYSEALTLHQIAKQLGLNKSYLSSLFRTETGSTFCQWLNQVRIERSKELIKYSGKTIATIALDVGYTSQSYFTSLFKQYVGITPNTYRKRWLACRDHEGTATP